MTRHAWVKVRPHVRICRHCGTGWENMRDEAGWFKRWYRPDGTEVDDGPTPACQPGPRTERAILKYAAIISATPLRKKRAVVQA